MEDNDHQAEVQDQERLLDLIAILEAVVHPDEVGPTHLRVVADRADQEAGLQEHLGFYYGRWRVLYPRVVVVVLSQTMEDSAIHVLHVFGPRDLAMSQDMILAMNFATHVGSVHRSVYHDKTRPAA